MAAAPAGQALFEDWLRCCADDPWMPLSAEAAKPYGFIWGAWLRFLAPEADAGPPHAWQQASAAQVLHFIGHVAQSPKQDQPSAITQRRYWRVLERIYDHALEHGWLAENPVRAISAQERPPSEDPKGAMLSPAMWRALAQQVPMAQDLVSARDRAVLLTLMHLGITPEEVRGLQLDDLVWGEAAAQEDGVTSSNANTSASGARHILHLQIQGLRECQPRRLDVPATLDRALRQWLGFRQGYPAMQGQPALFCSRKAPTLSNHTLLHLVTKTLQQAALVHDLPLPPRLGPQVVRNTVIVHWLEQGRPLDDVLAQAGIKSPHALAHLKDLVDPDRRSEFAAVRV